MSNNNYELIFISPNGNINQVNKNVWEGQTRFEATKSNITVLNNTLSVSKITQLNTGEFLYLDSDCKPYKSDSTFTKITPLSGNQYTSLTVLSNYKILLTKKNDSQMYTVDDVNNFDNTIKEFSNDGIVYSSVKQTLDGYVVAVESLDYAKGSPCGTAYRFDLKKNELVRSSKTKLNLDDGISNRVALFTPDQKNILNLNCDPRYQERINKYLYSDKITKNNFDLQCMEDEEYSRIYNYNMHTASKRCFKKCDDGYRSKEDDSQKCYLIESKSYAPDAAISADKSCRTCNSLCSGFTSMSCTKDFSCSGYDKGLYKTRYFKDSDCSYTCKSNRNKCEDNSKACCVSCRDGYKKSGGLCVNDLPATRDRIDMGPEYRFKAITCGDCCIFDLNFYNPLYTKPASIVLPDNLPVLEGLVGFYDASSFQNNIWYDSSPSNNNAVFVKGTFENNGTFISGTASSSILFPGYILPPEYTVFNIAKYNGSARGKILCGYSNNWFSGFANGLSGVAGRDKPITQMGVSAFDDNWVFSMDMNSIYGANGANYTTSTSTKNISTQLSINLNDDPTSNSDFAIGCVIVFNRTLSDSEIQSMQTWLTTKYADLYASTYTKTFAQLGYSCFNGSVGKVINNYNNYTYASYKNGTLDCKWLNLPEKKNYDGIICTSVNSEKYETFNNYNNLNESNSIFPDYIFYPLIIILLIIIIYKRCKKD